MTADDAAAPIRLDADTRAAIRARAEAAASKGEWHDQRCLSKFPHISKPGAAHIAGLDPATVVALLAALDHAEADARACRVARNEYRAEGEQLRERIRDRDETLAIIRKAVSKKRRPPGGWSTAHTLDPQETP